MKIIPICPANAARKFRCLAGARFACFRNYLRPMLRTPRLPGRSVDDQMALARRPSERLPERTSEPLRSRVFIKHQDSVPEGVALGAGIAASCAVDVLILPGPGARTYGFTRKERRPFHVSTAVPVPAHSFSVTVNVPVGGQAPPPRLNSAPQVFGSGSPK